MTLSSTESFIQNVREEFRTHLENLYSHLHLAPPYHSIEKAIQLLANTLRTKPPEFHENLLADSNFKWDFFREMYTASGLNRKHRGIIAYFMKTHSFANSAEETFELLKQHPDFPKTWEKPKNHHPLPQRNN